MDWTFDEYRSNTGLHSIHPYPARFVPHIPRQLIELFHPIVGGPVLDPFCGSGTTLVECQSMGIPSFGIDVNPIAVLISKVKTHPPRREIGPLATQMVDSAWSSGYTELPPIPRMSHWFTPGAAIALAKLTNMLQEVTDLGVQDALRLALSRIMVRVSRQDSDTRYAAVDRVVEEADVYKMFVESAQGLDTVFRMEQASLFRKWEVSHVVAKDILAVGSEELPYQFGMIVTSPPYPNAYEYWLYHKYRMYWLGEDPLAVRRTEIGARPNYFRKNPATPEDFQRQMSSCFALFRKVTLSLSLVCIVIGRSMIRGKIIDNAEILRSAARHHGFHAIAAASRRIPTTRKSFNPAHGAIDSETILVFLKNE